MDCGSGEGAKMVDLADIAARLDAEERLKVRYKLPERGSYGGGETRLERVGKLLDVEEDSRRLFVSQENSVIWIKAEEAIEVLPDDGLYE